MTFVGLKSLLHGKSYWICLKVFLVYWEDLKIFLLQIYPYQDQTVFLFCYWDKVYRICWSIWLTKWTRNRYDEQSVENFRVYTSNPKKWVTRHWNLSEMFLRFGNLRWRLTVNFELMRWLSFLLLWTLRVYRFPSVLSVNIF